MNPLFALSVFLLPIADGAHNTLPFSGISSTFKTNPEKYRAILLNTDFNEQDPDTYEGMRSFAAHFLIRTSAVPFGPLLNPGSEVGMTDQTLPLVGYDMIQSNGVSGYWPLFATTKSNLYVDTTATPRWVEAYGFNGPESSVECNLNEVVIGIRYKSHVNAKKLGTATMSVLPDIQCAPLSVAMVKAVDMDSVNTVKVDLAPGDTSARVTTTSSIVDMKQCMLSATNTFNVKKQSTAFNTCYGQPKVTSSSTSGSVLLIEYLLSIKPVALKHNRGATQILEFLIKPEEITADSLFGTDDDKNDAATIAQLEAQRQTQINKADAQYVANWGGTAPTIDEINAELGPTPWSSDQLIAGSSEFMSGSLLSGDKVTIVRGFKATGDTVTPLAVICGNVIGCSHGECKNEKCQCKAGYGGPACMDRLDPCGERPCGDFGTCSENFGNSTTPASTPLYTCACNAGWTGPQCGSTNNTCLTNVTGTWTDVDCGRGDCVPANTSYACQCKLGFGQATNDPTAPCDVDQSTCIGQWKKDVCTADCKQTETFKLVGTPDPSTVCPFKTGDVRTSMCTGGQCKQCMSRDCNGRGKCEDTLGSCVCDAGYRGPNCELSTDACSSSMCSGHGNCSADKNSCSCLNGWESDPAATGGLTTGGKYCNIDPCVGCPTDQCNVETGYCSCTSYGDPAYPKCANADAIDCQGRWSEWTSCTATCEKKRYYSIVTIPSGGGKQCPAKSGGFESAKCQTGTCCTTKPDQCKNGSEFIASTCECRCKIGFQGPFCETSSSTADRVVTIEAQVAVDNLGLLNTTARPELVFEQVQAETSPAPEAETNMLPIYIGAGVGGLLLVGIAGYTLTKKKPPPPTDPLLAGMEGLEGMDLTGMDLSALGLDGAAPAQPQMPI